MSGSVLSDPSHLLQQFLLVLLLEILVRLDDSLSHNVRHRLNELKQTTKRRMHSQ